jgi:hypothetical protein
MNTVLLAQLPGIGLITAITLLAAIGDIRRFPTANHLVGYAGLAGRVHDSDQKQWRSGITKAGRRRYPCRDGGVRPRCQPIPSPLAGRAGSAGTTPRQEQGHCGHTCTCSAGASVARKLLVAVWHVLTKGEAERYIIAESTARKMLQHAYRLAQENRPGQSAGEYVREQLDRLGVGAV